MTQSAQATPGLGRLRGVRRCVALAVDLLVPYLAALDTTLMIAAGVNIKTISEWMGHSSVNITLDRYDHLLPGSAQVALGLLDTYLEEATA